MSSYSMRLRDYPMCQAYHFEFFPKGFQVKYDDTNNNQSRQSIPFARITSTRLDYLYDDKQWILAILLEDGVKYSYCFRCQSDVEGIYEQIRTGILG